MFNAPRPPASSRSRLKRALVWVVGMLLLAWLLRQVPLSTVAQALARPSPWVWAGTLLGLMLSYLMRAARLQVVLGLQARGAGRALAGLRLDVLRVILMHNAAVNLLPMRAGELSFPWLASRELKMPVAHAVASLLWMRLQDVAVLVALGLLLWPGLPSWIRAAGLGLLIAGWYAGLGLLRWLHAGSAAQRAGEPQPSGWKGLIAKLHAALVSPAHHRPAAWGFTWANWTIKLSAGALLLSAITQAPLPTSWAGALGGELAAVVPLQGPAGFGTYEAGVWAGFALNVAPQSPQLAQSVPAALALHLCFLLCAVMAGALAWLLSPRHSPLPLPPRLPD